MSLAKRKKEVCQKGPMSVLPNMAGIRGNSELPTQRGIRSLLCINLFKPMRLVKRFTIVDFSVDHSNSSSQQIHSL